MEANYLFMCLKWGFYIGSAIGAIIFIISLPIALISWTGKSISKLTTPKVVEPSPVPKPNKEEELKNLGFDLADTELLSKTLATFEEAIATYKITDSTTKDKLFLSLMKDNGFVFDAASRKFSKIRKEG